MPRLRGWLVIVADRRGGATGKKAAKTARGVITQWLPPGESADEPALFRAVHDDGDEEDLEEAEAEEAIAAFDALPARRTCGRFAA